MDTITIRKPDDFHVHVRQGEMLCDVLPYSARVFGRALLMPNTLPPVETGADAAAYRREVGTVLANGDLQRHFIPLPTIKITAQTNHEDIEEAWMNGVVAAKLYPQGVTTNSEDGVVDLFTSQMLGVFSAMQGVGMVLCVHGESPDPAVPQALREEAFLPTLSRLVHFFPLLRVVFEHVSTAAAVQLVNQFDDTVAATITAHHLMLTAADVGEGDTRQHHHYCMPIAKTHADREALWQVIAAHNPKFFFGSDSAPHLREKKENHGAAGCFTAPIAIPLLASLFEANLAATYPQWHTCLENFTSVYGAQYYHLPRNAGTITLERRPMTIPHELHGIVPFMAGQTLPWSLVI